MGKIKRVFAVFLCLMALFGMRVEISCAATYETKNYNVDINVEEDNSFFVTETMEIDFRQISHGIYRYIPYKGDITYEFDGQVYTKPYLAKIEDITVAGFETDISRENNSVLIRIGSGDSFVSGSVTYEMSYRVTVYEDGIEELDQFYWGLISNDTPTPTEEAAFRITFPKEFDPDKVAFISGRYGEIDDQAVEFRVEGNTIYGETNRVLGSGEGVTLRVELPEGYFIDVANNRWMLPAMIGFILLSPITAMLLWFLFGRDKKIIPTVEFYPPEGVSSAEIGYILDGTVDDNDVVSMLLYFADKGYLEIHEEEKNSFKFVKKKELGPEAKMYEQAMFRGLFAKGDQVNLNELKEEFYDTFTAVREMLAAEFTDNKGTKVYTKGSKIARFFSLFLMIGPPLAVIFFGIGYKYTSSLLLLFVLPVGVLTFLGFSWLINTYDKKDHMKKSTMAAGRIGGTIVSVLGLAALMIFGFTIDLIVPAGLAIIASLLCFLCAAAMKQRTPYSIVMMEKILGFKEFIRSAELDRLKLLVEETPHYFYHILPYAYIFGLTDKWAKHFEGIAMEPPEWYNSSYNGNAFNTYVFLRSFQHCTRAMQSNITVPPMPEGGGNGIGGGGFSGGGFSGGGMGGGGMGSW